MYDSDDNYFSDDLVLDDKTLAVLDEEESKFKRTTDTQTQQSVGPPAKRQKTTGSWQPQSVSRTIHRTDTLDDIEDLPDVSIRQDGTYGLLDKQRRASVLPSRPGVASGSNVVQTGSMTRPTTTAPSSRGSVPPVRRTSATGSVRATQVPSRLPSSTRGARIAQSPISSQDVSRTQAGPPQRVNRNVSATAASNAHVEQLLQQIEEVWYLGRTWLVCVWIKDFFLQLRKKNEAIHTEMESALEAKFSKEGEVTILRKRLEKVHGMLFDAGVPQ